MPQNALIVIVDPGTRSLTRSVLEADIGVTVVAVDTALEGLAWFEMRGFDLVVIDFERPITDDFRALELLCRSASAVATPIVALTPGQDDPILRRAMVLGIAGAIAKPVERGTMSSRLLSYVSQATRVEAPASAPAREPVGHAVLVADGDLSFRQFATSVMRATSDVLSAATGTDALKLALEHTPALVIIGQGLGLMNGAALATRMRTNATLRSTRLVAVVPEAEVDAVLASAVYDGVVARTFVPEYFRRQIDRQLDQVEPG